VQLGRELSFTEYINVLKSGVIRPILRIDFCRNDNSVYSSFFKYPLIGSNYTADCSSSGVRRSVNLILDNKDGFCIPNPYSNNGIWIGTRFNLYSGIQDNLGNYKLFSQGQFVMTNSNPEIISSTSDSYTVNIKADDKYSNLSSNSLGDIYQIPAAQKVTDAIRSVLKLAGDNIEPIIESLPDNLPNTVRWDASQNYGTIIKDLANIYSREVFYDQTGNLVVKKFTDISTLETIWEFSKNEISYMGATRTMNFQDVYNRIVVLASNSNTNALYKGIAENNDLTSATRIGFIPTKTKVIQDDNIYSDILAQERADMELEKVKRIQESITINSLCLPHVDVNKAINITDSALGLYRSRYAIQKFQYPLDMKSSMSLTCLKYNDGSDFENLVDTSFSIGGN
jgi:hypothetical protein